MRFGVVVCPGCRRARGLELHARESTCPRCQKRVDVKALRVFFRTDDAAVLQAAVGAVEARLATGEAGLILDAARFEREIYAAIAAAAQARSRPPSEPPRGDVDAAVQWAASRAVGAQGDQARATRIVQALDEAIPEGFTLEQLEATFRAAGLPEERAGKEIRRLLARDEVYEPRPGVWKRLG